MTVRDDDALDGAAIECAFKRPPVRFKLRPGIDDDDVFPADDVGTGPLVGEFRGILGNDSVNQRRHSFSLAVGDVVERFDERNDHDPYQSAPVRRRLFFCRAGRDAVSGLSITS